MTRIQNTALATGALALGGLLAKHGLRARRRIDFKNRSVLITGGSRGLGLLVARELAEEGARLTLAARNLAELERARTELESRGFPIDIVACDIGKPGEAARLVKTVVDRTGRLDVLINNAGVITVAPLDNMARRDFEDAMAVHFWGPLDAMLAAIPVMRAQGEGRIVNVSSIGGRIGVPHLAPYCASKFALTGLSDSVRSEIARDGIFVTTVCPGLMRTGSPFNAWFKGQHREEFTWFAIADSAPLLSIDGRRAARQLVDACRHGDAERVISWPAKLAVVARTIAPEMTASAAALANRFVLPDNAGDGGHEAHSGWQSLSRWAPSRLTRTTERAAYANNEVP